MKLLKRLVFLICVITFSNFYSQQAVKNPLGAYNFLIGTWEGEGGGKPGEGTGIVTFEYGLDKKIIIRKNHNEYPANNGRPAFIHDDIMTFYMENNLCRAIYFDNEGHVIYYTSSFTHDSASIILVSDINPGTPRFKFTYNKLGTDKMRMVFEVAPTGKPEEYKKYVEGIVKKKI